MILLRTHAVDPPLAAFADRLEAWSGLPVRYLVDERRGAVDVGAREKVSLTAAACTAAGLHCPHDFAWRCGDYGFYLARAQFGAAPHVWLIENDVRIAGHDPAALFARLADHPAAMIASYVEPAPQSWAWSDTVLSRDARPYKCFFPVVRLSAAAIDVLHERRRAHAGRWARRRLWSNDEGFVATTLVAAGLPIADLNDAGVTYRTDQFSFEPPIDGDQPLASDAAVALFHPVLSGAALAAKRARLAEREAGSHTQRLRRRIARRIGPDALARAINRRASW